MKILTKFLTVLAISALGQSAYGVSYLFQSPTAYVDQEFWFDNPLTMDGDTTSISGSLDVSAATGVENEDRDRVGYNPLSETITAVEILFAIDSNLIDIQFGGENPGSPDVVFGDLNGLLTGNSYIHAFNFSGTGLDGSLLMKLVDTGVLNWTLSLTQDQLDAEPVVPVDLIAASLAVQVPDSGATIGLFGVCLLGLAGMRRKLSLR